MADKELNAEEIPEDEKAEVPAEETAAEETEAVAEEAPSEKAEVPVIDKATEDAEAIEEAEVEEGVAEAEEVAEEEKGPSGVEKVAAYMSNFLRDDHPDFKAGDTIKVHLRIVEGGKERIQVFEGVVIALKHAGLDRTFTVRKVTWSVGVERTFFYHSKKIDKIKVIRRGKVRRAKIYYLRKRIGKAARIKELRRPKATKNPK